MFAPTVLLNPEDHVCGSGHGLSTPYWSKKKALEPGKEINTAHVGPRGGRLGVTWFPDSESQVDGVSASDKTVNGASGHIRLRGEVRVWARGVMILEY